VLYIIIYLSFRFLWTVYHDRVFFIVRLSTEASLVAVERHSSILWKQSGDKKITYTVPYKSFRTYFFKSKRHAFCYSK